MTKYISIIIHTRDDDFGIGFKGFIHCLSYLISNLNDYKVSSEIIIVDWNSENKKTPYNDRVRTELNKLEYSKNLVVIKHIKVQNEIHNRYKGASKLPVYGALAVNVGIRRAEGEFILSKAMDTYWSKDLFIMLAAKKLKKNTLYRCDRHCIEIKDKTSFFNKSPEAIKEYLLNKSLPKTIDKKSNFQHKVKTFHIPIISKRDPVTFERKNDFFIPKLHTNACGDFQLASRDVFYKLHGYEESSNVFSFHADSTFAYCAFAAGVVEKILDDEIRVNKIVHSAMSSNQRQDNLSYFEERIRNRRLPNFLLKYHTEDLIDITRFLFGMPKSYFKGYRMPHFDIYKKRIYKILTGKNSYKLNKSDSWGLKKEHLEINIL